MSFIWGTTERRDGWDSLTPDDSGILPVKKGPLLSMFACERLLAAGISSLPIHEFRKKGNGREQVPLGALIRKPAARGTRRDWVYRFIVSLARHGNAFGLPTTWDGMGRPTTIEWLDPQDVVPDSNDPLKHEFWFWKGRRLLRSELIHIPWHVEPGKVMGLSPVGAFATEIRTGKAAQEFAAATYEDGATPPAVVSTTNELSDDQAATLKRKIKRAGRRREVVVIPKDYTWTAQAARAEDLKFLESIKANATQIASIYGIPAEEVGGESGKSLTYSTVELNQLKLITTAYVPYLVLAEQFLEEQVSRDRYIKFSTNGFVRADLMTRMRSYEIARRIGKNSVNEIRGFEDEEPIEGGDDYTPLNIMPTPPDPAPSAGGAAKEGNDE